MSFFTTPPPRPLPTEPSTFRTRAINLFEYICTTLLTELESFFTTVQGYATAMNTNDTRDTSLSSVLIGSGSKTFTVSAGKSFSGGQWLTIADTTAPSTNSMVGQVTSYNGTTLVVNVPANSIFGSGTKSSWVIALTAAPSADISAAMKPVTTAATLAAGRTALDVPSNAEMVAATQSPQPFRNRVLNGDFSVDQEFAGASVTLTAGAALKWVIDGWYGYCTGANVTFQTITVAGRKRARFTGAASNTGVGFATRIEAADSADIALQFATLRALLSSSSITTVNWGLYYANTANTFGAIAAPTRTAIQTGSFTINSSEAAYSAITAAALASGATTGLELVFTVGALTAGNTLTFGDVQIEKGSIAAPVFANVEIAETKRCERLFQTFTTAIGGFASATAVDFCLAHKGMRITPSASVSAPLNVTDITTGNYAQSSGIISITESTADGGRYQVGNFTGATAGRVAILRAGVGGKIFLDARLTA